ncbi:MAG TPA: hypothetical protein VGP61_09280 [Gemmatimonadales bacterium]|nr:hypothetical protein [Gemmatimonadales bacterium]
MNHRTISGIATLLVAATAAIAAGCSSSATSPGPTLAVGDITSSTPATEQIKICKNGNVDGTFALSVTPVGSGNPTYSSPVTVAHGTCKLVVQAGGSGGANVTIHETSAGFVSATAVSTNGSEAYTDNVTVLSVNGSIGHTVTYTNNVTTTQGCTLTQGYWKNHASQWPVTSLTLGSVNYTQAQLLSILNTPVQGNGLISLAYQLIAAKLNVAAGASPVPSEVGSANTLIGSLVIPPVGSGFLAPSATSSLTSALDNFNNGLSGPPHCP